jgi:quercetin dioxygenase-like cupin family protein
VTSYRWNRYQSAVAVTPLRKHRAEDESRVESSRQFRQGAPHNSERPTSPSRSTTGGRHADHQERHRDHASSVHFTPGARTAWHTHPNGQTIYVTEGVGLCQRRGGPVEVIRPGDRVFFEPAEEHWHGATADRFMTHLALLEVDADGNSATWGAHVSDEEYGQQPG